MHESLGIFGFMVLGSKETLRFSPHEGCYEETDVKERIYPKVR
jgi:hypothetical protein